MKKSNLNVHDSKHTLVKDGVAHVLGAISVGGHLRKNITHRLRGLRIIPAQDAEQPEDAHLQERIRDTTNIVLASTAGRGQALELAHQGRHHLSELQDGLLIHEADLVNEGEAGEEDGVGPLVQHRLHLLHKVLVELWHLADHTDSAQGCLLPHISVRVTEQPLNLRAQVACHLCRRDISQRRQGKSHNIDVRVVQVALAQEKETQRD